MNDLSDMTETSPVDLTTVDFHFDVMCPWAYQTSRWMREVRDRLDLTVNWKFFSLEEVNRRDGKKHPWEREWSYGWSMMRIGAVLRRTDMDLLDRWYAISGRALHEEGKKPHEPDVARHLLAQMGVDPAVVDEAIADPTTHDDVRLEHERVMAVGGFGVPTLFFGGPEAGDEHCLFGPVLIDPPTGDAAERLWRALTAWIEFPDLYEIQRPKTRAAQHRIADTFRPYLEARDWISINRGKEVSFDDV